MAARSSSVYSSINRVSAYRFGAAVSDIDCIWDYRGNGDAFMGMRYYSYSDRKKTSSAI